MWMTDYISEIQKQLISKYKFKKNEKGLPADVPDGDYPMMIDGKLDRVKIINGYISCCNFE